MFASFFPFGPVRIEIFLSFFPSPKFWLCGALTSPWEGSMLWGRLFLPCDESKPKGGATEQRAKPQTSAENRSSAEDRISQFLLACAPLVPFKVEKASLKFSQTGTIEPEETKTKPRFHFNTTQIKIKV